MSRNLSSEALIVSVLALGDLGLRVGWLRDVLQRVPLPDLARSLDEVAQQSYSGLPRAREALLAFCIYLVLDREAPVLVELRQLARRDHHFNLERLLRTESDVGKSDWPIPDRVPNYGTGRELTVGERRALARRPSRNQLEKLLEDPHPLVLEQLFGCPTLTEPDVLRVLSKRPARPAALTAVCRHPKWLARRHVRTALIQNPGTPIGVSLPLVATIARDDLRSVVQTTTLPLVVRSAAHELFLRLPPIEPESHALQ